MNEELVQGNKFDEGKLRFDLLPLDALEEIVRVYTFGAQKYGDRNWEKGIVYSRFVGASFRHILSWFKGSKADEESGIHPLAHAAWSLIALLTYDLRGMAKFDDYTIKEEN